MAWLEWRGMIPGVFFNVVLGNGMERDLYYMVIGYGNCCIEWWRDEVC